MSNSYSHAPLNKAGYVDTGELGFSTEHPSAKAVAKRYMSSVLSVETSTGYTQRRHRSKDETLSVFVFEMPERTYTVTTKLDADTVHQVILIQTKEVGSNTVRRTMDYQRPI